MLKTSKFKKGDIVSIKLISGEEIVTKLGNDGPDWEFVKPVVLSVTPQGMGLAPYIMTAEAKKLTINVDDSNDDIAIVQGSETLIKNGERVVIIFGKTIRVLPYSG